MFTARPLSWLMLLAVALLPVGRAETGAGLQTGEYELRELPMAGDFRSLRGGFAGLLWYDNQLIFFPQDHFAAKGLAHGLTRGSVNRWLEGRSRRIMTIPIRLEIGNELSRLRGFAGFSAVALLDKDLLAVAVSNRLDRADAFLVRGEFAPIAKKFSFSHEKVAMPMIKPDFKSRYRALAVQDQSVIALLSRNSDKPAQPHALLIPTSGRRLGRLPVTGSKIDVLAATAADRSGRFIALTPTSGSSKRSSTLSHGFQLTPMRWNTEIKRDDAGNVLPLPPLLSVGMTTAAFKQSKLPLRLVRWEAIARLDEKRFILAGSDSGRPVAALLAPRSK